MKKMIITTICILSITSLTACATKTGSQKGLKKSPCACVFQSLPSADLHKSIDAINPLNEGSPA
ncbi:hypothetical protein B9X75_10980 [Acinetobacter pittii]|jgi:hypothetical protein|uniref:hypothetical protein n=1 Tax=Acinetobacter radioresistens TaxID=40216 RepID=UPI000277D93A|nr:putative lipoprotein [Acinetobacter radioresistens WC-A-157]KRI29513.1 hypothetical protein APB87_12115 [Acinetobacter pittii]PMC96347.1 hypothetical protein CJ183_12400 [Acinetobacter ursingii]RSO67496.1 hypothetical protein EA749_09675 [Acinetobacter radioresistens]TPR82923.1 hypothetical protein FJV17_17310 [Acinetobacter baumannii]